MTETPKSLTAVAHVKFNYQETEAKTSDTREIEMLSRILGQTSSLSPERQEIMVKFADYLSKLTGGAAPTSSAQLDLPRKPKEGYKSRGFLKSMRVARMFIQSAAKSIRAEDLQKSMRIVKRFIQIVKRSIHESKLKEDFACYSMPR